MQGDSSKEVEKGVAVELYKQDGSTAGIYYCSTCRVVYSTKESAERCHGELVCVCGKPVESRYQTVCYECQRKESTEREAAKELELFEKARKITEAEYDGDMVFLNDRFADCVRDAIDEFLPGHEPEYVWACKDVGVLKADSDSIIEKLTENMWEDANSNDLKGVEELDAAIEAFNKANSTIKVYQPDYTTAILTAPTGASHV